KLITNDFGPPSHHATDAYRGLPAAFGNESFHHGANQLWAAAGGSRPTAGVPEAGTGAEGAALRGLAGGAASQPAGGSLRLGPTQSSHRRIDLVIIGGHRCSPPFRCAGDCAAAGGWSYSGVTVPFATIIRRPSRAGGTSWGTAAVMRSCS